jgi:serine phosphatase RsbU (regulator of sigma subunit)
LKLKLYWGSIRSKMLIIFVFFSVISMSLVGCFAVAVLNVVIRRESAYLVEERIKLAVYERKELIDSVKGDENACTESRSNSLHPIGDPDGVWPATQVTVLPWVESSRSEHAWDDTDVFAGVVSDRDHLEIRSFHRVEREGCSVILTAHVALDDPFLKQLSNAAGLQVVDSKPALLGSYRAEEGIRGEIEANFVPGSRRPVPIVVIARNWQTGQFEDWVVCQVRPSYSRTIDDLGHMGLRTASWVAPFGAIVLGLVSAYAFGLFLSLRLAQRIVNVIDGLSHAALRVGKGDFSVRVADPEQDQLGRLAASFNAMTQDLENLREHEKQRAILERDIALGREAQQYLYPRQSPVLSQASVWGVTQPAHIVSGDLYDFLSFTDGEVGLVCADVSGKGTSAALMMASLQAVAHGRLLLLDNANVRPAPDAFVAALNRDLSGRFGDNRYATLFYGEFDSQTQILRYVNGGHTPPIFISAEGEVTRLPDGDLPVGMFPDATFEEHRVIVPPGSSIVVYTDGVSDALNSAGEEFGEERIMRCLSSLPRPIDAEGICNYLAGKVAEWAAGADRSDDTTILALSVDCLPSKPGAVRDDKVDLGANARRACNSATDPNFADPVHFQNVETSDDQYTSTVRP